MFAKEFIKDTALQSGVSPTAAGFLAGAGGGVCQVSVMGPCTFLVTSVVTNKNVSLTQQIKHTWKAKVRHAYVAILSPGLELDCLHPLTPAAGQGFKGFYPGGTAIAFRQATNWASRQGFTDAVRERTS
jgi:hypothetical protein